MASNLASTSLLAAMLALDCPVCAAAENSFGLVYKDAIRENAPGMTQIHPVTYNLNGIKIAANVYTPPAWKADGSFPAIVVAHPNGGVKEQVAGFYAQRFANEGYVTIAADVAYQGASGGGARHLNAWRQAARLE